MNLFTAYTRSIPGFPLRTFLAFHPGHLPPPSLRCRKQATTLAKQRAQDAQRLQQRFLQSIVRSMPLPHAPCDTPSSHMRIASACALYLAASEDEQHAGGPFLRPASVRNDRASCGHVADAAPALPMPLRRVTVRNPNSCARGCRVCYSFLLSLLFL